MNNPASEKLHDKLDTNIIEKNTKTDRKHTKE